MAGEEVRLRELAVAHVAQEIWAHTGGEGDCPDDGAYQPCEPCLRGIFMPAAEAVLDVGVLRDYFGGPPSVEAEGALPTPEEVADLLRSVEFAMSHGRSAMVAFFDTKYETSAIERDYERMKEVERQVKAMLDRLPPAPPMTPEHEAKVGGVVAAALNKRFGDGTAEELVDAMKDAWPSDVPGGDH